jgi:hypothetical protein
MFGFSHQEGTDRAAEIAVIKHLLKREDLLMKLHHLNDTLLNLYKDVIINNHGKNSSSTTSRIMNDKVCNEILNLLSQIRESTLSYLEALCLWRQTAYSVSPSPLLPPVPRPFMWKGGNYTLKLVNDLDFLAENDIIVTGLLETVIPSQQLRSNPLMLMNNLDDPDTWMDPYDRAVRDAVAAGLKEDQMEGLFIIPTLCPDRLICYIIHGSFRSQFRDQVTLEICGARYPTGAGAGV